MYIYLENDVFRIKESIILLTKSIAWFREIIFLELKNEIRDKPTNPSPIIVYRLGIWLNLTIPTNTVATIHSPANEA